MFIKTTCYLNIDRFTWTTIHYTPYIHYVHHRIRTSIQVRELQESLKVVELKSSHSKESSETKLQLLKEINLHPHCLMI